MNIPMTWLRDIVNIPDETHIFTQKITDAGVKVEGITSTGQELTNIVVGQIKALTRHPDADKLWVTQADIGTEVLQIVTGADNLQVGDYIPVALHGATLANGLKIKKSKMRGQESNGMLCSIGELGCTAEDFPFAADDGIFVFPEPHPLGADARPIMGLTEEVLDIEVLSNRPDTNAVMGIAREVAAVYDIPFSSPDIDIKEEGSETADALVSVEIADEEKCPRYIARVVEGVSIAPSPRWLQKRLIAAGMRPVNNIVDITNYVMLEYGQPLHAFDISYVAKKEGKHAVIIRTAREGEKITTLDGAERVLTPSMLLITDPEKPLAIAGIMGGENTKITDETTTILFESANFNAANIRQSAKSLGMRTDASARYEKGPDPSLAVISVNRAMQLVEELACGRVVPGMVDAYPAPRQPRTVPFCVENINNRLGTTLDLNAITAYLKRVGIIVQRGESTFEAVVPTFRADVTIEDDLAEEVARFYGYNNISSRYAQRIDAVLPFTPGMSERRRFDRRVRTAAVGLGYYEAITYPFESPKIAEKLLLHTDDPAYIPLVISNPLGEDLSVMRPLPFGGVLTSLSHNFAKRNPTARLFEIAWAYCPKALPLTELPAEKQYLTLAAYGTDVDFLSMKGDVEDILAGCVGGRLIFEPPAQAAMPFLHPGRAALVSYKPHPRKDPEPLGYIGVLHPQVCANFDMETRVLLAVLDMEAIYTGTPSRRAAFTPPPKFPALVRDLAFTVPEEVSAAQCEATIRERGGSWLAEVTLFDVYRGGQVGEGRKSMAYNLRFAAPDRTLTDENAQKQLSLIRTILEQKLSAQVR